MKSNHFADNLRDIGIHSPLLLVIIASCLILFV